jgi:hypothetical protein
MSKRTHRPPGLVWRDKADRFTPYTVGSGPPPGTLRNLDYLAEEIHCSYCDHYLGMHIDINNYPYPRKHIYCPDCRRHENVCNYDYRCRSVYGKMCLLLADIPAPGA